MPLQAERAAGPAPDPPLFGVDSLMVARDSSGQIPIPAADPV
ncbi:hypothetical protein BBFGKLBO_00455 [Synechococcus sp. CBW1107]|nr:hypothetical protein BBFGKLBO_00455 [Synechococcus sp. CBW1107]